MANGNVEFIDKTGQPKSEEDLKEALNAIESLMVKSMLKVPPELAVQLPTIRGALIELLHIKKVIKRLKEEKRNDNNLKTES